MDDAPLDELDALLDAVAKMFADLHAISPAHAHDAASSLFLALNEPMEKFDHLSLFQETASKYIIDSLPPLRMDTKDN